MKRGWGEVKQGIVPTSFKNVRKDGSLTQWQGSRKANCWKNTQLGVESDGAPLGTLVRGERRAERVTNGGTIQFRTRARASRRSCFLLVAIVGSFCDTGTLLDSATFTYSAALLLLVRIAYLTCDGPGDF